ncbi:hypothetical protein AMAG_18080 [Allomyces macrogynus ATCC 38327]|uniref:Uncharacterized protein n=1 Tax=Allomyces macrogynus (strain ATCC 38327) TaxID=578462 RepID=A0A0L0S9D2_ALLM3|nr:hypothetical protein AMAG_18080 [Allomyces macrogynus ATCC 38327]|eukprot:KNE59000.1 hypothetical protein AMAG_18080 [Allomyces macrogynus ATCC 38327]
MYPPVYNTTTVDVAQSQAQHQSINVSTGGGYCGGANVHASQAQSQSQSVHVSGGGSVSASQSQWQGQSIDASSGGYYGGSNVHASQAQGQSQSISVSSGGHHNAVDLSQAQGQYQSVDASSGGYYGGSNIHASQAQSQSQSIHTSGATSTRRRRSRRASRSTCPATAMLKEERALLATLKVDQETLASRVRGLTAEIEQLEPELDKAQASRARVDNDVVQLQQAIARKEAELQRITEMVDEQRLVTLQGERTRLATELDQLSEERDRIAAEIAYLIRFDYNNPTPNFKRNAVRGSIASLMAIDQADFHKADALEMAGGARLQNVCCHSLLLRALALERFLTPLMDI